MTDPIADMLTRMRNALAIGKKEVVLPTSKIKVNIASILKREGYIDDFSEEKENYGQLKISLKYKGKTPAIKSLKRVSKPGRRVYAKRDNLPVVLNNFGLALLSTPQGLMTNKEAKKVGLGGEVLCEIY